MAKSDITYRVKNGGTPTGSFYHVTDDDNFDALLYWSGAWVAGTYEKNQVVTYGGGAWVCVVPSTAAVPGADADWEIMGGYQLSFTDLKTTAYQAIAGEIVLCDLLTTGVFTVTAPANPTHNQRFAVKIVVPNGLMTIDSGTAGFIESHQTGLTTGPSVGLFGDGRYAEWRYDAVADTWLAAASAKGIDYFETWQATPIVNIAPATTILWTFVPLFPGQIPSIATHAAGVFTLQIDVDVRMNAEVEHSFVSIANNSEAACDIGAQAVAMTGVLLPVDLRDSMTAPRVSGVDPFVRSGSMSAIITNGISGDTFQMVATELYSTSMSVNLDGSLMTFRL